MCTLPYPHPLTNYTVWYSPEPWPYWCRRGKSLRNVIGLVSCSGGANLLNNKKIKKTNTQSTCAYYIQTFHNKQQGFSIASVGKMWRLWRWECGAHYSERRLVKQLSVTDILKYCAKNLIGTIEGIINTLVLPSALLTSCILF